ncbi:ATP-dependent Clp protease adaptor ClpS [Pelagibacterium limicola]|uniref:ATP-dependent Clp protease adaptor ClpS n=1 Tax=Pelagibacterium limicola TaxID=2791022 RepID=UPI0018AF7D09|nr:ATP-dependent Clp protease adaptor ClpS [Pelagibacterium limicola]
MSESITKGRTQTKVKTARPRLYRVVLLNDDYTPRDFVVLVLKAVFRLTEDEAHMRMITAHQKGVSVVAVYTSEIAEAKATEAVDLARDAGFPLMFVTEPEE